MAENDTLHTIDNGSHDPMRIVALDAYGVNPGDISWEPFKALGKFDVFDNTPRELLGSRAGQADAILVNRMRIGAKELDAMPRLRYIGAFATGYNFIDTTETARRGITVTNIPAYSTMSVAQATWALLLEVCNHTAFYDKLSHSGQWSGMPGFDYQPHPLIELDGKKIGIIGLGNIGHAVGRMADAFGMKVAAYTSRPQESLPAGWTKMDLPTLMKTSDVVSVHCPLTPQSRNLVNAEMIASMKPGAIFINTARGAIADENALADALNEGKIHAGLDVLGHEPPEPGCRLLSARNCIVTPHVAWATRETRNRAITEAAANLKAYISGSPVNVVG